MKDSSGRTIEYLRISITSRCSLHCQYCRPAAAGFRGKNGELSPEKIVRAASAAAELGVRYIKVTGGEPLLRKDCADIIRRLKEVPGIERVTVTTNGLALQDQLPELEAAGVDGINVSLDTLDREYYREMTGSDGLPTVMEAIRQTAARGIRVKINSVLIKGREDWRQLILLARDLPVDVRLIEMMPLGAGRTFETEDYRQVLQALQGIYPDIYPDRDIHGPGPAVYYKIPGFQGSIGFIGAVHGRFCSSCNRMRLTAEGYLKACLCYSDGADLKPALELDGEEGRQQLKAVIAAVIQQKPEAHCFDRPAGAEENRSMAEIGG